MIMVALFGLLFWCLAGFREDVWTQYTSQDVARWQAQAAAAAHAAAVARSPAGPTQVNTGRKKLRS